LNIYEKKQRWKYILLLSAILIGAGSLFYTNRFVGQLKEEERQKMKLWAEAYHVLNNTDPENGGEILLSLTVIENNSRIPVILADDDGSIITWRNLDSLRATHPEYLQHQLELMRSENDSITINIGENYNNYIFYRNSLLLRELSVFPYIQLAVIILFILVSYIAFSVSRKAEQNEVWTGLTKETAHQLGTPVSSLLGWVEIIKNSGVPPEISTELGKDVSRLERITERFSKIGAKPSLTPADISQTIRESLEYLQSRGSDKVHFEFKNPDEAVVIPINETLFSWVIENLCKNSMDAIEGNGTIRIEISSTENTVNVDVSDTGKGIQKSKFKTIFKPGYTTKKRGWGLGLSLASRIIEMYHNGKIFVLDSDPANGTTIRIQLHKKNGGSLESDPVGRNNPV